jgi:hypothetical protein
MNQDHWRCAGFGYTRQHKSLYSGVISQPDVFALHAKNQLVGNPPYSILPYVRNETPSVYDP